MPDNRSTDSDERAERSRRAADYAALAHRLRKLASESAYAQTKASLVAMAQSYEGLAARLSENDEEKK